jgi:hypothetical protein
LDSHFLDLASRHRGAGSHIEVEGCNHGNANHREQERANPLALNTPGSLSVSMNNLSCLSLHNDLYIWAIWSINS